MFAWDIKHYGPEVDLFVDHSQIVQIEPLHSGVWGTQSLWWRVLAHKGDTTGEHVEHPPISW
jgi:phosphosulfolactate synthase (CoM biosynthesis protein A)